MNTSMPNRLVAYGILAIWEANTFRRAYDELMQRGANPPDQMGDVLDNTVTRMAALVNQELPDGLNFRLRKIQLPAPHRHKDRHGDEISCETAAFYCMRDDYGLVGHWENDSGNTVVHTGWIGQWDRPFMTMVRSTDPGWDNMQQFYACEEEAAGGHKDIVLAIQSSSNTEERDV